MDSKKHAELLRLQLLSMSRLSQRALDYAAKGYQLGNSDFCRQVRVIDHKLLEHHRQIEYLCHKLTENEVISPADFRFALAALRIGRVLLRVYVATTQITQHTILLLERSSMQKCAALDRFGELINSLMRLCTVSLFESEERYAEVVLQSRRIWRRYELIFDHSSGDVDQKDLHSDALSIPRSLGVIAKRAHELADAILFWLKSRETEATHDAGGSDVPNFLSGSGDYGNAEYCSVAVSAS